MCIRDRFASAVAAAAAAGAVLLMLFNSEVISAMLFTVVLAYGVMAVFY